MKQESRLSRVLTVLKSLKVLVVSVAG